MSMFLVLYMMRSIYLFLCVSTLKRRKLMLCYSAATIHRGAVHRQEDVDVLRLPEPEHGDPRHARPPRSSAPTSTSATLLRAIFLHPEFYSTTASQGLVRSPVEWVVACLKALGMTAVERNPQWWMDQMGQQLFYPPNVAGWKNNAYWVNSTALWARADFARNLTWRAEQRRLPRRDHRSATSTNQHVDVRGRRGRPRVRASSGSSRRVGAVSPYVRGVLVNWLEGQRVDRVRADVLVDPLGAASSSPR